MDRKVRQLGSPEGERKSFGEFTDQANLVLLGEPGSGKTHLFRSHSSASGGLYLTVRSFLIQPDEKLKSATCLFIDALDEKRATRADSTTIDALVEKLLRIRPPKTRIACRAIDWRGDSDLVVLNDYFDISGGSVVVALEGLVEEEQAEVLRTQGEPRPNEFLESATQRGLGEILGNPQTLLMLHSVVRNGGWPQSRKELFDRSCLLLLSEENEAHTERDSGKYAAEELIDTAGAMLAIRLIGDADGLSARTNEQSPSVPSYRQLMLDPDRVRACLGRRLFVQTEQLDCFDYAHRTLAEFLAARWLSRKVSDGLSIPRLLHLLGRNWRPASELRGLYAWLTVFLSDAAETLLDGDPYGCLAYGDAASLSPGLRTHLLRALARLSEEDPWFRSQWDEAIAWGLSGPDLIPQFEQILGNPSSGFALRSIVLDALKVGPPRPELGDRLKKIAKNKKAAYAEREDATRILFRWDPKASYELYSKIEQTPTGLRLKIAVLWQEKPGWATAAHFAEILSAGLKYPENDNEIGTFWLLGEAIPDSMILTVLASIRIPRFKRDGSARGRFGIVAAIERLVARGLVLTANSKVALGWLLMIEGLSERLSSVDGNLICAALDANHKLKSTLPNAIVHLVKERGIRKCGGYWRLVRATKGRINFVAVVAEGLKTLVEQDSKNQCDVFELVLLSAIQAEELPVELLEAIVQASAQSQRLADFWERFRRSEIPEWRADQALRSRETARKRRLILDERLRQFDEAADSIAAGSHLNWAIWAAKVYCGRFADLPDGNPVQRLQLSLDVSRAEIVLRGISIIGARNIPTLDEILEVYFRGKYVPVWFVFITALDLKIQSEDDLIGIPRKEIEAAVAIDTLFPSFSKSGQIFWKWRDHAYARLPNLVANVLAKIASTSALRMGTHIDGLYALTKDDRLRSVRRSPLLRILRNLPDVSIPLLESALPVIVEDVEHVQNKKVAGEGYCACAAAGLHDYALRWLVFGLIVDPEHFLPLASHYSTSQDLLWVVRDLNAHSRHPYDSETSYVDRLVLIATYGVRTFPLVDHPRGGWVGSRNAWDASEYVRNVLASLSSIPSEQAQAALESLAADPAIGRYSSYVRHLVAENRQLRIDASFVQPTWREARDALLMLVPASAAELSALLSEQLLFINRQMAGSNTDIYKLFWNEDQYRRILDPKPEESARDALINLLRFRVAPIGVAVEPEGHMAQDKRADIVGILGSLRSVVEVKRDYHSELWTAAREQLDRFYTNDPQTGGFGIYCVLWYGARRPRKMPSPPDGVATPTCAEGLQKALEAVIPAQDRSRIFVNVIDVSGSANSN